MPRIVAASQIIVHVWLGRLSRAYHPPPSHHTVDAGDYGYKRDRCDANDIGVRLDDVHGEVQLHRLTGIVVRPLEDVGSRPVGSEVPGQAGPLVAIDYGGAILRCDHIEVQGSARLPRPVHRVPLVKGDLPDDMPEMAVSMSGEALGIAQILSQAQLTASNSEAFRMIKQGAVRVDGQRVADRELALGPGEYVVQVGKRRFARVTLA